MKFKDFSYKKIAKVICGDIKDGDEVVGVYLSGPMIVDFLCELGVDASYKDFGTRYSELQGGIKAVVESGKWNELFTNYLALLKSSSSNQKKVVKAFEMLNRIVGVEGYKIQISRGKCTLANLDNEIISAPQIAISSLSTEFLSQQVEKCYEKISKGDYDGAITNARSMVEEVLLEIEKEKTGARGVNDGDVAKIYNRVKKLINLSPDMPSVTTSMQQIMTGLSSVVAGLGSLRSKISDSHAPEYKAGEHHALLCVNCAMTLVQFLVSTYENQKKKVNCVI